MSRKREPGQEEIQRAVLYLVIFSFLLGLLLSLIAADDNHGTPSCISDADRAAAGILTDTQRPVPDCRYPSEQFTEFYLPE